MLSTAIAGLSLRTGFSEAMDFEGYKSQLITATKQTQVATQVMQDMVKKANETPFEAGELISAASRLEMMQLSSKKWMDSLIDSAGSTGKSIMQVSEALIDAQQNQWERMSEALGIKRRNVEAEAKKLGMTKVFDAKGQILDQDKMMQALMSLMNSRFKGGADKLSKTMRGMWSTVTGNAKLALAEIVGMNDDGTARMGSSYHQIKNIIEDIIDAFSVWQADGTITTLADRMDEFTRNTIQGIKDVIGFVQEWKTELKVLGITIGTAFAVGKVYNWIAALRTAMTTVLALSSSIGAMTAGQLAFNVLASANPYVVAATAIAGILYVIWKRWDHIDEAIKKSKTGLQALDNPTYNLSDSMLYQPNLRQGFDKQQTRYAAWDKYYKAQQKEEKDEETSKASDMYQEVSDARKAEIAALYENTNAVIDNTNKENGLVGGSYVLGGFVGYEAFDFAKSYSGSSGAVTTGNQNTENSVVINLNVDGNIIGNTEFADEVGEHVFDQILKVYSNK